MLEANSGQGSRYALRFVLPEKHHLYCFEFDYPDDARQICDLIVRRQTGPVANTGFRLGMLAVTVSIDEQDRDDALPVLVSRAGHLCDSDDCSYWRASGVVGCSLVQGEGRLAACEDQ